MFIFIFPSRKKYFFMNERAKKNVGKDFLIWDIY